MLQEAINHYRAYCVNADLTVVEETNKYTIYQNAHGLMLKVLSNHPRYGYRKNWINW